jgi:DNA-binding CsgD family transcriptional regulator
MNLKCFSSLIDGFYAAALQQEQWAGVATQLASYFDSESTAIQVRNGGFNNVALRATTANYDDTAQQAYAAHFHKLDLWANAWRAIGASGIYTGAELVSPESLRKSEICVDFCHRVGIFHFLGAGVHLDASTSLLLGIHRPMRREDFTAEHQRRLELVLPHLTRAVQTQALLTGAESQRLFSYETSERLSVAMIMVDVACRVIFANHVAERLLQAGNGLMTRHGCLTTRHPGQESALQQAVRTASAVALRATGTPSDPLLIRRLKKSPLSVLVVPLRQGVLSSGASAIVFACDPEAQRPPPTELLAASYGLTPAEARLLAALAEGARVSEYAERFKISVNTVNTQLKQIFAKMGTNRQVDLMRKVLSDPVFLLIRANGAR